MESGALYPEMEEEEHMSLFDLEMSYRKNAGKCVGVLVVLHFLAASLTHAHKPFCIFPRYVLRFASGV